MASTRLEEIYRRYIKYCEEHPEEYRLLTAAWAEVFGSEPAATRGESGSANNSPIDLVERFMNMDPAITLCFFCATALRLIINMVTNLSVSAPSCAE